MGTKPRNPASLHAAVLVLACALALLLFFLGLAGPGGHFWGRFLLPIVVVFLWGSQDSWRRDIYIVTALASLLVVLTYWTDGAAGRDDFLANHLLPIAILWAVAWLLAQRRGLQEQLRRHELELDEQVKSRTAALAASEEKFRSLVEASDAITVLVDAEGRILYVNERAAAAQCAPGVRVEDVVGKILSELPPPIPDLYLARVQEVIATNDGIVMESAVGTRYYRTSIQPVHDAAGKPFMALMIATDITAPKTVQHELEELNRSLEARVAERTAEVQDLYDNAPAGYHSLDANGCFVRINQTELEWLGYTRAELIGRPITQILSAAAERNHRERFPLFKQRGSVYDQEVELVRKDGTSIPVLLNATALYDEGGRFAASRSTLVDITEHKRAEQALRQSAETLRESEETLRLANAELARALRIKDEFLANMSHELRTPLHGILAMCETLLDEIAGPLNARQLKSLRLIDESGRHLLGLINDLLDLSKIEAGKLELHDELVAADDVCQGSLLFVREMASKKGVRLEYASPAPGAQLRADPKRLKQMLVNLLSNAVKFTPRGGQVCLTVAVDAGAGRIDFTVEDNGPGIAPADQARLFLPFVQVETELARLHEGTGLGLALVKRLAEQHGGSVRLESTGVPGEGARFTISLPLTPPLTPPV